MENSIYYSLYKPSVVLEITGEDAFNYLQSQFSNDLRSIGDGGVYGLFLNSKGKVVGDSFIIKNGNEFILVSYFSEKSRMISRLEENIIADDVTIRDLGWTGVCFWGTEVENVLKEMSIVGNHELLIFKGRHSSEENFDLIGSESEIRKITEKFGKNKLMKKVDSIDLEIERIVSGIPAVPSDIGESDLPNEGSLHTIAVSYNKGCYLGQEIMQRLNSKGNVRRSLCLVKLENEKDLEGNLLFYNNEKIGDLRSRVRKDEKMIGIAMVKNRVFEDGEKVSFTDISGKKVVMIKRI